MLEDQIQPGDELTQDISHENEILETVESPDTFSYGDLYVLGKLWIRVLEAGLLGTKWRLPTIMPVVEAAQPKDETPKKPPKMKYKDLPLYTTPHHDYKDYKMDKYKCPKAKDRLVHQYLFPRVRSFRRDIQQNYNDFNTEWDSMKKSACNDLAEKKRNFIKKCRDPDYLLLRQIVVALGGVGGYCFVGGRNTLPRVFGAGVGLLATGAMFLPKETDKAFRKVTYTLAKVAIRIYNINCNAGFAMRERLPCKSQVENVSAKVK